MKNAAYFTIIILLACVSSALTIQRAANPATNITDTSAIITWTTDLPATSSVAYGTTKETPLTITEETRVVQHITQLTNLIPRTTYFYKFSTQDDQGNTREDNRDGALFQFTTLPPTDRVPPKITNLHILDRTEQTTTIAWLTDEPATTTVYYGTTTPTQEQHGEGHTTDHALTFQTTTETLHTYLASSCDTSFNCANTTPQEFIAGILTTPPPLNLTIPSANKNNLLTLAGTTRPLATITIFIHHEKVRETNADNKGTFTLRDILLTENTTDIRVEAKDTGGSTEKTATVIVDHEPPHIIVKNITGIVTTPEHTLPGETNKPVTLLLYIKNLQDAIPPEQVKELRILRTDKNRVELAWKSPPEEDVKDYLITRNGERIAKTTTPEYIDTTAPPKKNTYQVIAVDTSCNLAIPSQTAETTTKGDAVVTKQEKTLLPCEEPTKVLTTNEGPFSIPLKLSPGLNTITLRAIDDAQHTVEFSSNVTFDSGPPSFLETNLEALSPSYIPEVPLRGKVSEPATIFVYLNGETKPEKVAATNPDGSFEIPLILRRDVKINTTAKQTKLDTGEGFENTIVLEAIDQAGLKKRTEPKKVIYALCGFGGRFDIKLGKPLPSMLIPRLVLQKIQEIGMTVNATYTGRHDVEIQNVQVNPVSLAPEFANRFDNKLVTTNLIRDQVSPKTFLGLLQIKFVNLPDDIPSTKNTTVFDKEDTISKHRLGWQPNFTTGVQKVQGQKALPFAEQGGGCLTPGLGCMKFFIELEINYQEKINKTRKRDPLTNQFIEGFDLLSGREKTCIPVEVTIDKRPSPKKIPKGFLKATIKVLDDVIELMDTVLKPLTIIGEYTTYACLGTNANLFLSIFWEKWQCEGKSAFAKFQAFAGKHTIGGATSESKPFEVAVAKAGLCDEAYDPTTQLQQNNDCHSCRKSIESSYTVQYEVMQPLCDRVACPSAPTLQTHVRQNYGQIEEVTSLVPPTAAKKWRVAERLFFGNDCSFTDLPPEKEKKTPTPFTNRLTLDYKGVKKIYDNAKDLEEYKKINEISREDCDQFARPAHPACCGRSYMREWSSACGYAVPIAGTIYESFDELKESVCESAQAANNQKDKLELDCGGIANAVAGFCEPGTGNPVVDFISTGIAYKRKPGGARTDEVQIVIVPMSESLKGRFSPTTIGTGTDQKTPRYRVYRGYIKETFTPGTTAPTSLGGDVALDVNAKTQVVAQNTVDLTPFFSIETQEGETAATGSIDRENQIIQFTNKLCDGTEVECTPADRARAKNAYETAKIKIEYTGKTYIVKPDQEGILRSFQCACLPALTAYVQQARNIFAITRQCMMSILLTGDGSEGVCQSLLSVYLCDLIYDVIKCFMQKWNSPGAGVRGEAGILDIFSTITSAGTDMQRRVQSRYGETQLWKTMFLEKKLVHSICLFAFTGTWNFDISNMYNNVVENIPIESQGFFPKCTRRFVNFDPTTNPRGKTTWNYHLGMGLAAGADLKYRINLKCSSGFRCNPADGFRNGECDCNKVGEKTIEVVPECTPTLPQSGVLKRGEILNTECFHTIQSGDRDANVRYDTAILDWEYRDPKTQQEAKGKVECNIGLAGEDAPGECALDPFHGTFRCSFGIGASTLRFGSASPVYPHQIDTTPVFGLGDDAAFTLGITQFLPEERQKIDQHKKYLFYTITDHNGNIVEERNERSFLPQEAELKTNGDYERTIKIPGLITQQRIAGTKQQPQPPLQQEYPKKQTNTFSMLTTTAPLQPQYVFTFHKDTFNVYEGDTTIIKEQQTTPDTCDNDKQLTEGYRKLRKVVCGATRTTNILSDIVSPDKKYTITLALTQQPADNTQIIARPTPLAIDACTEPQKPVTWTALFKGVDTDNNGRPTNQVSVDPATGKKAEKETSFNVICIPNNDQKLTKYEAPKPPQPGQCKPPTEPNLNYCMCGAKEYNCPNPKKTTERYCVNDKCTDKPICPVLSTEERSKSYTSCICGTDNTNTCTTGQFCCNSKCENDFSACVPAPTPAPPKTKTEEAKRLAQGTQELANQILEYARTLTDPEQSGFALRASTDLNNDVKALKAGTNVDEAITKTKSDLASIIDALQEEEKKRTLSPAEQNIMKQASDLVRIPEARKEVSYPQGAEDLQPLPTGTA